MRKLLLPSLFALFISLTGWSQTIDPSFNPKLLQYGAIRSAIPVADNKIIVGGLFNYANSVSVNGIARLNANGTVDGSFDAGTGADGEVKKVLQASGGKLIVVGSFKNFNGVAARGVVRLNANGSIDATFNADVEVNRGIETAAIQSNGKVIVAVGQTYGSYTIYHTLKRLNGDGSLDDTFHTPVSDEVGQIFHMNIVTNDKILVGGYFGNYDGLEGANQIVRLKANGVIDDTFSANMSYDFGSYPRTMALLADGKMLIYTNTGIKRINENGSADGTFAPANSITGYTNIVANDDGSFFTATSTSINRYSAAGALLNSINVGDGLPHHDIECVGIGYQGAAVGSAEDRI